MPKTAIWLRFDAVTEASLRTLSAALVAPRRPERPHVSLAVFDAVEDATRLVDAARRVAAASAIVTRLAGVGAFPGPQGVVFALPTVTAPLLALHEALYRELGVESPCGWPLYHPGAWVPHATLATGLSADALGTAIERARTSTIFAPTTLVAIEVVTLDPLRDLAAFTLNSGGSETTVLDVDPDLRLRPIAPWDADAMFELTDANRAPLRAWLPWLDGTRTVDDTRGFIDAVVARAAAGGGTVYVIDERGSPRGCCGFNWIVPSNRVCQIGYWLSADAGGRGVMTRCVDRLVRHAFDDLDLNRIEIPVATGNARSRAVCERLEFRAEGVLREAEWLYDHFVDHVLYARLRRDVDPTIEPRATH